MVLGNTFRLGINTSLLQSILSLAPDAIRGCTAAGLEQEQSLDQGHLVTVLLSLPSSSWCIASSPSNLQVKTYCLPHHDPHHQVLLPQARLTPPAHLHTLSSYLSVKLLDINWQPGNKSVLTALVVAKYYFTLKLRSRYVVVYLNKPCL